MTQPCTRRSFGCGCGNGDECGGWLKPTLGASTCRKRGRVGGLPGADDHGDNNSSSSFSEHSEAQLGLIEEYAPPAGGVGAPVSGTERTLEAEVEIKRALLSQHFDDAMADLEEYYQTRIDIEAGAQGTLQDLQATPKAPSSRT